MLRRPKHSKTEVVAPKEEEEEDEDLNMFRLAANFKCLKFCYENY
jgi:hypothetical protein